jgi:hypothetical protein
MIHGLEPHVLRDNISCAHHNVAKNGLWTNCTRSGRGRTHTPDETSSVSRLVTLDP